MKNPEHYFLTLKALIIAAIGISISAPAGNKPFGTGYLSTTGDENCSAVINEIMADPSPTLGLPGEEWVELFNPCNIPVRLKGWKLISGTSVKTLPDSTLMPGEYVIVCSAKAAPELKIFGKTVILSTFPVLRNSGSRIVLLNAESHTVDSITYSDRWYGSGTDKEGGRSLERMDPLRRCGQSANWKASEDPKGGTPGSRNSVFSPNPDLVSPFVISIRAVSVHNAVIVFSEPMDSLSICDKTNYTISGGIGNPDKIEFTEANAIGLYWKIPLEVNRNYTLSFGRLSDACGNKLRDTGTEMAFVILKARDLVINEILFDPWPGGSDFVEIYNRSAYPVDINRLLLATRSSDGRLKSQVSFAGPSGSVPAGGYLTVTADTGSFLPFYRVYCHSCLRQLTDFPSFSNDLGTVVLLSDSVDVLDEMTYTAEMHHPLLSDTEGVSLERVNPEENSGNAANWQSASSEAGFATPGYRNSQYMAQPLKHTEISFDLTSISPDNDGYHDGLTISYSTPAPGWIANCMVFDPSGRKIFQFLNNAILSVSGTLQWNGDDGNGGRLSPGPCIFFFELFDLSGHVERHRKVVVLTVRDENH